jgi:cytochrome P450
VAAGRLSESGGELMSEQSPVVHFDHHSPEFAADPWSVYDQLRTECPVARSDTYGGFWVLTRYADVARVFKDDFTFSSDHDVDGTRNGYLGITIPSPPARSIPIEMDPPEFFEYRKVLNPPLAPGEVAKKVDRIRAFTTECIDAFIESGRCDFVHELAVRVPAFMTLELLGIPTEKWERYAEPLHASAWAPPDTPDYDRMMEGLAWVLGDMAAEIERHRHEPDDGLLTHILNSTVGGEPIPMDHMIAMAFLVAVGGLDTTAALLSNTFLHLDDHPELRAPLRDDEELRAQAFDEFMRYFTPTQSLARTVTADVEIGGQEIKAGDRVFISMAAANRDPQEFDRPNEIVLDRFPNRHMGFGLGAHRCVGSHVGRAQWAVVMEEVLRRMGDYRVAREDVVRYRSVAVVYGYRAVPCEFTPGPREG